jgi:UDP-N-acetylglucosamine transferase subunit ALG13
MVQMVAELKQQGHIPERVVIQTGEGGLAPTGHEVFETLPYDTMQRMMTDASVVVCHGGTGSLITALRQGCRVIAVPRRFDRGEHYDDHQMEITSAFAARGLIAVADSPEDLVKALDEVRARAPVVATTDASQLTEHLQTALASWEGARPTPSSSAVKLQEDDSQCA